MQREAGANPTICSRGENIRSAAEKQDPGMECNVRADVRKGRVGRNWTKSGGRLFSMTGVLLGELAQVPHYPEG